MKKLSSNNVEPLLERSLFFMADLEDKILEIFEKKDNDLVEVHRWHIFHLETWLRITKSFLDQVNLFHPTIKFTTKYCKEEVNSLDLNINLIDAELKIDLVIKLTDTHQILDPISSHPYRCKKGIPYNQGLSLNRICSVNENFDKRCNDL